MGNEKATQRSSRRRFLQASAGVSLTLACRSVCSTGEAKGIDGETSASASSSLGVADPTSTSGQTADQANPAGMPASASDQLGKFLWHPKPPRAIDLTVAFRAECSIPKGAGTPKLQVFGAHWFNFYVDGELLTEGPARFDAGHPEYEEIELQVAAGRHTFATAVQAEGVSTRLLRGDLIPAFLWCRLMDSSGREIPLTWKCQVLEGYIPSGVRVNPQLAWIEWCDLQQLPQGWKQQGFSDSSWVEPVTISPALGTLRPLSIGRVKRVTAQPKLLEQGYYTGPTALHRGQTGEDIPVGLLRRDFGATAQQHDGVWRRYDLGQVRLFRPRFVLDVPAGTQVDFVYSETLNRGAVLPLIPLSVGPSYNFDHYVASGGEKEFFPLAPRGGRYLEVHVSGASKALGFRKEETLERTYFEEAQGSFQCEDDLLNRVWQLGVATLRGCTEDAVNDNPTRERGEWTGDVVTVGMALMAAAHDDLRLIKRGLRHSAWCSNDEGIVAGLCPGGATYVSTYALQWIGAVMHHFELTGDRDFLVEMLPYAKANLGAFAKQAKGGLLSEVPGTWAFVDWGYQAVPGKPDLALNLHYLMSRQQMSRWLDELEATDGGENQGLQTETSLALQPYFNKARDSAALDALGYHATALAFHAGLWKKEQVRPAIETMKAHMLRCFPNDRTAPRLSNSAVQSRQLITPYFSYYAFPPLIENGDMDFVLDQYRTCWGYALEEGRTTMLEVFDPNWSHCHQWACSPTWQVSRYVLGLHPRYDIGPGHYLFNLKPGALKGARGTVPVCDGSGGSIQVDWSRNGDRLKYCLTASSPVVLHRDPTDAGMRVEREWEFEETDPGGAS